MVSYITIGGSGSRLKQISHIDKHLLYYKNKRIIEWIMEIIPDSKILGHKKTSSRKETLLEIKNLNNVLIIDCDIIPFGFDIYKINMDHNCIFVFQSDKPKWGSVTIDNGYISSASEKNNISNIKCSGIYFIKNLSVVLDTMTDPNSLASGMIGAKPIYENTFIRLGDVEDYMSAIKSC